MSALLFFLLALGSLSCLALRRQPMIIWAGVIALLTLIAQIGLPFAGSLASFWGLGLIGWSLAALLAILSIPPVRRLLVIKPAYRTLKKIMPRVSETEREALEAGTVGWDAELFSGDPDWDKLEAIAPITLTAEERAFLDGPAEELCRRLDDWDIRNNHREIPDEVWKFVSEKGFLGMLISKEHGGLGFSAQAQSLVLGKLASRSPDAVTIVMVPNSLGPGELIEKYGTGEQKSHYLPRLARGDEIPCFALTGPTSGSDAATMRDIGTVEKGMHDGEEVVGIRINWDKRYISLGPKATLLGLAFRLFDPDNHLGRGEDLGITLALIPANHSGVEIGRRHLPCGAAFPNGPTWGKDVFIPIEWVIGGAERAGQGWRMLMECLSAGRSISLPASSTAAAKTMLRTSTAYGRIRKQFGLPIARMEGIEEPLARIAESAYVLEAARAATAAMVAAGEKPAAISALLKYQSTERMRQAVNDAFDIHGGRAICDGPSNYLQAAYQMVPVAITVEGANILTRTLITFAQGALRSHPWLYKEVQALQHWDDEQGLADFEDAFEGHVSSALSNIFGALAQNVTFGLLNSAPDHAGRTRRWYKELSRGSRNFAVVADMTVGLLGGGMKVKQKHTGRMADALSELYFLSCILKRFEDDGMPSADLPILDLCSRNALHRFEEALYGAVRNFPVAWARPVLRILVFPLGRRHAPASDTLAKSVVRLVLEPGEVRDRLTRDIFITDDPADPLGRLEHTLAKVIAAEEADKKLESAVRKGLVRRYHTIDWIGEAEEKGVLTAEEANILKDVESLVETVIAVDHFSPEEVTGKSQEPDVGSVAAE